MRRPSGVLLLTLLVLLGLLATVTTIGVRPRPVIAAAPSTPLLVGDSVMAGMSGARGSLAERHPHVFDAEVCRRLVSSSCSYRGHTPATAIDVIRRRAGDFGGAIVVAAGYNDGEIGAAVDAVVAEARRQGVAHVVWLSYRVAGRRASIYEAHNATLAAKAAEHPELSIADWAGASAERSGWVSGDGLHLTGAGGEAMATLIAAALDGLAPSRCALAASGLPAPPISAAVSTSPPGGMVLRASPLRVVDTRSRPDGAIAAGHVLRVDLAAAAVPADSLGVVATLAAVDACGDGYLTAFACGDAMPPTSALNYRRGETIADTTVVATADGVLCVFSSAATDVTVDVTGHIASEGSRLSVVGPHPLVDTRPGATGLLDTADGPVSPGGAVSIAVGRGPWRILDAAAVVVDVVAIEPSAPGFVTLYPGPCAAPPPATTTLTFGRQSSGASTVDMAPAGAVAVVRVGDDGTICAATSAPTHLVVDLIGIASDVGARIALARGARIVDTRASQPAAGAVEVAVPADAPEGTIGVLGHVVVAEGARDAVSVGPCPATSATAPALDRGRAAVATFAASDAGGASFCVERASPSQVVLDAAAWLTVGSPAVAGHRTEPAGRAQRNGR